METTDFGDRKLGGDRLHVHALTLIRFGRGMFARGEPMSPEENKAVVRRVLDAPDQRNFDALKEHPG